MFYTHKNLLAKIKHNQPTMTKLKITLTLLIIHVFFINIATSQVDTLMVFSKAMNKNIPNIVITPDNYSTQNTKLPV